LGMTKHPCAWSLRNVARFSAGLGMSEALSRSWTGQLCVDFGDMNRAGRFVD
jgi:hypothetical protein